VDEFWDVEHALAMRADVKGRPTPGQVLNSGRGVHMASQAGAPVDGDEGRPTARFNEQSKPFKEDGGYSLSALIGRSVLFGVQLVPFVGLTAQ
jgi:hypothetical protein